MSDSVTSKGLTVWRCPECKGIFASEGPGNAQTMHWIGCSRPDFERIPVVPRQEYEAVVRELDSYKTGRT